LHGERTKGAVMPANDNQKCKESNERGPAAEKNQKNADMMHDARHDFLRGRHVHFLPRSY
jgi:hypothetical protein